MTSENTAGASSSADTLLVIGDYSNAYTAELVRQLNSLLGEDVHLVLAGRSHADLSSELTTPGPHAPSLVQMTGPPYRVAKHHASTVIIADDLAPDFERAPEQRVIDLARANTIAEGGSALAERLALAEHITDAVLFAEENPSAPWYGVRTFVTRRSAEPENVSELLNALSIRPHLVSRDHNPTRTAMSRRLALGFERATASSRARLRTALAGKAVLGIPLAKLPPINLPNLRLGLRLAAARASDSLPEPLQISTTNYRRSLRRRYARDRLIGAIKVSVIIPAFNPPEPVLVRAIESALTSTHANLEIIVVDDGSHEPIASWLPAAVNDDRLRVLRQENAGQGPARNLGVDAALGEYVFFMDADDSIEHEAISLLLTHATTHRTPLVVGRRVIVNEESEVLASSFLELFGDTYRVYRTANIGLPLVDGMVHGRLIHRSLIADHGIRFSSGHYEDRAYATALYTSAATVHFANVVTYFWTKHSAGGTSSSTFTLERLKDKITSVEDSWPLLPARQRPRWLREFVSTDFAGFLENWAVLDPETKDHLVGEIIEFVRRNLHYAHLNQASPYQRAVFRLAAEGNREALKTLLGEQYRRRPAGANHVPTDNYFCHTHYQVIFSLLLILERGRPAQIFIYTTYQSFPVEFAAMLREFPHVDHVMLYDNGGLVGALRRQVKVNPDDLAITVPSLMRAQFSALMARLMPGDTAFASNDDLPSWWAIERSFPQVTRMEDAFGSLVREIDVDMHYGVWGEVYRAIKDLFPPVNFTSRKIDRILVARAPEKALESVAAPIEVFDVTDALQRHRRVLLTWFERLYSFDPSTLEHNSTLVFTQPLAGVRFCSESEQRELYRAIVSHYGGGCVIKPHPADRMDYTDLGCPIIDRNVPSEAMDVLVGDRTIARAVAFSSTAVVTCSFASERIRLFGDDLVDRHHIHRAIVDTTRMFATGSAPSPAHVD